MILIKLILKTKNKNIKLFCNYKIKPNTVLITEYEQYHQETLLGFLKYFIDLNYNVNIFTRHNKKKSLNKIKRTKKVKIIEFNNTTEILNNLKCYKTKLLQYKIILLNSWEKHRYLFYKKLGLFNMKNLLIILHDLKNNFKNNRLINRIIKQKKVFSIIDSRLFTYLNPNYYGEFNNYHKKNKLTTFFIVSSNNKNYKILIDSVKYLKNLNLKFIINVVGHDGGNIFNEKNVPNDLKSYFNFSLHVEFQKMFDILQNSDFIIINLFFNSVFDKDYLKTRATGSAQLAYGFNKPVIIEKNFAKIYKFSSNNSFIFENNNLKYSMLKSINITKKKYLIMVHNIKKLKESIYNYSLNNLKKVLINNNLFLK